MEQKDWIILIASLIIPIVSIIGALIGTIIGGFIVIFGNKHMFRLEREQRFEEIALNRKEKRIEKILEERNEAYKELYRIVIGSWGVNAEELSKQSREWSKNYDLFSTKEISGLLLRFWLAHQAYDANQNEKTRDTFGQSILNMREEIRKQLGVELADPEYLIELWDFDKGSSQKEQ